jgi:cytosine/adenosine deaminase-related metal-dependent hydrolase
MAKFSAIGNGHAFLDWRLSHIEEDNAMTLIALNADVLVTMDAQRREIRNGALVADGPAVQWVGATADLPPQYRRMVDEGAAQVLDMRGRVVMPGLVNTHHHMYQSLTRAVPAAQDAELFSWLTNLYMLWSHLTPEMVHVSTQTAMAELMLSGCTTTSDHLYLYPNGARLDDSIAAAQQMGMRFHAARGSMSLGRSKGGLPPDAVVEEEEAILRDSLRLIQQYHDSARHSMLRVVLAPCSPFSVTRELMRESAVLARAHGVSLHTHLAENDNDVAFSREKFGLTPAQYAESLGWVGPDVWHAHCVKLDPEGIALFARTGTGVAHCPCSNMRLASGIAPVRTMRDAGVPVGLGVDGSASTMAPTCWARHARPCCCSAWATARPPWARARRWRSPPWAARACWAAMTSARWRPACRPTSWPSTCRAWAMPARATTRWRRWCSARPPMCPPASSTAASWSGTATCSPPTCRAC